MSISNNSSTELSERLFTALSSGDWDSVRQLCSKDCTIYQNTAPLDVEAVIGGTTLVLEKTSNTFHYENAKRSPIEGGGFLEQHEAVGTLASTGNTFKLLVACVGKVENGKITEVREYFDPAPIAELVAEMTA